MSMKRIPKRINYNFSQVIILVFLLIILAGALLLALPISSKTGESCGFLTALFTATSAVCVTGLSRVDIWTTFSFFGQVVLLFLMEIGGLGFMSLITIPFHLTNHSEGVQTLSLSAEALGLESIKHIKRIQKRLLIGSFLFESIGAVILCICFIPVVGFPYAVWFGIFHSVSAFCNAGFDLMGYISPGVGLTVFYDKPAVLLTVAALIVIGGIGFTVWDDIAGGKHPRYWTVYTRLVLIITALLLLIGTIFFFVSEYRNPGTLGSMTLSNKLANAFFQAVTPRTAGFASMDQSLLSERAIAGTSILMMIGGSAGSTAGGIKTVTFLIMLKALLTNLRGKRNVRLMQRSITDEQIQFAFALTGGFMLFAVCGGFFIDMTSDIGFHPALYESISALATVGLSLGVTSSLSTASCLMLILLMYIGRVGLLTVSLGFFREKENSDIKYPTTRILIG